MRKCVDSVQRNIPRINEIVALASNLTVALDREDSRYLNAVSPRIFLSTVAVPYHTSSLLQVFHDSFAKPSRYQAVSRADGMIILACSMKTLAAVNTADGDGLISGAVYVTLKGQVRLVLVMRVTFEPNSLKG
ncbi:hypothetical protein BOTCAL_0212g00160 [Botryotinia calthae]|uniref:Flavoprotein domain-containing protein n=1 Tax=Botryotinia calthae TaxID=38488 RepID=A0A4Y8CZE9_9HELO|nr:hypothetical protein BOTCAL_0212g00160 [Botryotinia calthae]